MSNSKLSPNSVWLFSLVTLGLAIALTYVVPRITGPMTPKAFAAIYFVVFGAGSMAATYLSSASAWRSVGAYAVGSVGLGIFYYAVIAGSAGGVIGGMMGLVFGLGFAVSALFASIAGSVAGSRIRAGKKVGFSVGLG